MSSVPECSKSGGNSDISTLKAVPCKRYCFTYNNYDVNSLDHFKSVLNVLGKYIFGYETAPTTGTKHLQGYINLKTKERITGLIKKLGTGIHFEKCKGSETDNIKYCTKGGQWESNFYKEVKTLKVIKDLRPWQKSIVDLTDKEPDERTINWVYDKTGNNGKTAFSKYMISKGSALVATAGDAKDIANLLTNCIEAGRDLNDKTTFIFNIARSGHISYSALEGVKDGLMTNIKYEAKQLVFNSPHVWVFSNDLPNFDKLSDDRWKVWTISDNILCEYHHDSSELTAFGAEIV